MGNQWKRWSGLFAIVTLVLVYWQHSKTLNTSTTSLLLVESKLAQDQEYWIQGYNPHMETREEIKIRMPDRRAWESVSEGESYVLTYNQVGQEEPIFVELVKEK